MKKHLLIAALLCAAMILSNKIFATDYIVTNTADSGEGSLRQAITSASSNYIGSSNIYFNIPTTDANYNAENGTFTISILSELPYLIIAGNINFEEPDEETNCINIIPETKSAHFDMFLSNSFGFGGTNSTLIIKNL